MKCQLLRLQHRLNLVLSQRPGRHQVPGHPWYLLQLQARAPLQLPLQFLVLDQGLLQLQRHFQVQVQDHLQLKVQDQCQHQHLWRVQVLGRCHYHPCSQCQLQDQLRPQNQHLFQDLFRVLVQYLAPNLLQGQLLCLCPRLLLSLVHLLHQCLVL